MVFIHLLSYFSVCGIVKKERECNSMIYREALMKIPSLRIVCALGLALCLGGCGAMPASMAEMPEEIVQKNAPQDSEAEIYLAGGCFWVRSVT